MNTSTSASAFVERPPPRGNEINKSYVQKVKAYEKLANEHHWLNADGSVFPISQANLDNYISYQSVRVKDQAIRFSATSLKQNLSALHHYHKELGFPWNDVRNHELVKHDLRAITRDAPSRITARAPEVTLPELLEVCSRLSNEYRHRVLRAILCCLWHGLGRVYELVYSPADQAKKTPIMIKHIKAIPHGGYSLLIPHPKVKKSHEQYLILMPRDDASCPVKAISCLLSLLRSKPANTPLWRLNDGSVPDRCWLNAHLKTFFTHDIDCSSFRAGGATHLVAIGTHSELIRNMGRWTSQAWELYIRAHPAMLSSALSEPSSISVKLSQLSLNDQVITQNIQSLNETCLRLGDQLTRLTEAWGFDQARELMPMARPPGNHS